MLDGELISTIRLGVGVTLNVGVVNAGGLPVAALADAFGVGLGLAPPLGDVQPLIETSKRDISAMAANALICFIGDKNALLNL